MNIKKDLKSLASSAVDVAKGVVQQGKLLAADSNKRMDICRKCECFHDGRCSRDKCPRVGCNCWMQVKTQFAGSKCPKGKW